MVWLVLCLLWLDWQREAKRWVTRSLLGLALLLIVMSRSGTGLVTSGLVGVALLSTGLVRGNIRSFAPTMALMLIILIIAATAGASFWFDVLHALGRDPTLTGRTVLWEHILGSISDRTLLGYGYAAYWYGAYGPGSAFIESWGINSAHNGWLEAALDLGVPGLIVLVAIMGRLLVQGFFAARYGASRAEPAWAFAVGCALVAISISESVFLERHSMNWIVLVVGVVRLMEHSRRQRALQVHAQARTESRLRDRAAYANAVAYAGPGRPG